MGPNSLVAKTKDLSLKNLNLTTKTPLILVAEAPEKPGNIGALLRTADAANIDAVIIANPLTDLYNPISFGRVLADYLRYPLPPELLRK